jgi:hypothetical protein
VSILRSKEPGTERTRDAEARLVALADAVSKARVK